MSVYLCIIHWDTMERKSEVCAWEQSPEHPPVLWWYPAGWGSTPGVTSALLLAGPRLPWLVEAERPLGKRPVYVCQTVKRVAGNSGAMQAEEIFAGLRHWAGVEKILWLGSATDVRFKPLCLSFRVKSQNEDNASFFLQWASRDGAPSQVALEKAQGPAVPRLHSGTPGCTFPRMRKIWRTTGWAEKLTAAAAGSLRASSAGLHLRRGQSRILLRAESGCVYIRKQIGICIHTKA